MDSNTSPTVNNVDVINYGNTKTKNAHYKTITNFITKTQSLKLKDLKATHFLNIAILNYFQL